MAQLAKRVMPIPVHISEPFYTLKKGQNHVIKAQFQTIQIVSGVAWVSNCGEDYILKPGEAITLFPGGDNVAVIASLFNKAMKYSLKK